MRPVTAEVTIMLAPSSAMSKSIGTSNQFEDYEAKTEELRL